MSSATETSSPIEDCRKRVGNRGRKLVAEYNNKGKTTSPLEERKTDRKKWAKREEMTYAEICKEDETGDEDLRIGTKGNSREE